MQHSQTPSSSIEDHLSSDHSGLLNGRSYEGFNFAITPTAMEPFNYFQDFATSPQAFNPPYAQQQQQEQQQRLQHVLPESLPVSQGAARHGRRVSVSSTLGSQPYPHFNHGLSIDTTPPATTPISTSFLNLMSDHAQQAYPSHNSQSRRSSTGMSGYGQIMQAESQGMRVAIPSMEAGRRSSMFVRSKLTYEEERERIQRQLLSEMASIDFNDVTVVQMKKLLRRSNAPCHGNKQELMARLRVEQNRLEQTLTQKKTTSTTATVVPPSQQQQVVTQSEKEESPRTTAGAKSTPRLSKLDIPSIRLHQKETNLPPISSLTDFIDSSAVSKDYLPFMRNDTVTPAPTSPFAVGGPTASLNVMPSPLPEVSPTHLFLNWS